MICVTSLLAGCTKSGLLPNEEIPYIAVDMKMEQTRALISQDNLNTSGSRFTVYDMHTSADGPAQYLDNQNLELRNGTWSFTNTAGGDIIQIPWTKTGTHDFLAYNTYDAAAGKSLPVSVLYSPSNTSAKQQSLRVPSQDTWTLNLENQFDFIYGSATRNIETDGYTALPISFKHLFAAIAVEVRNASTQQLKLSSLSFSNIKDRGYAQVNYGGNVQYSLSATQTTGLFSAVSSEVTIAIGSSTVLYNDLGEGQSFLIWPHPAADLAGAAISIAYKLGTDRNNTSKTISLTENYTVKTWTAGNKYKYLIAVTDDKISFDVIRVVDWINDDIILEE